MILIKQQNDMASSIIIEDYQKILIISFCRNGDLYWSLHQAKDNNNEQSFIITKENYALFELFEQLFKDISDINIFLDDSLPWYINTVEKERDYYASLEEEKEKYRLYNHSNYNELFDKKNQVITWYSDETAKPVANYLKIEKKEDTFLLKFFIQPYKEGYDRDFSSPKHISIRFRNSGSRYDPFNILFMRMYNNMNNINDVLDENHQLHIEEYLYKKERIRTN